jgi:REP element-mobilizing transposase RayT
VFLKILDEVRTRYEFLLVGYVVMPEHIHLLISEPRVGTPSTVMQVLKQRVSLSVRREERVYTRSRTEVAGEKRRRTLCTNRKGCGTPNFNGFNQNATSSPGRRVGHPPAYHSKT